jgi:hypothetical protein
MRENPEFNVFPPRRLDWQPWFSAQMDMWITQDKGEWFVCGIQPSFCFSGATLDEVRVKAERALVLHKSYNEQRLLRWQPIVTAPHDGTVMDVWEYCHDPKWRPVRHGIEHGWRLTHVQWHVRDSRITKKEGWVMPDVDGMEWLPVPTDKHFSVSHWMIVSPPISLTI